MNRLREIFCRIAFVTIWIIGGGFAVMFVLLSFHADTFPRQVMINLLALGFLIFSYFCHKLLNWILAKKEIHNVQDDQTSSHISISYDWIKWLC